MKLTEFLNITVFILCTVFVLVSSGCVYNDEPVPEITSAYSFNKPRPKPHVTLESSPVPSGTCPVSWLPMDSRENRSRWQAIVIHHSATDYGCAAHEHKSHIYRGWDGLGYHFVINNGVYRKGYGRPDGMVEVGYRWTNQQTGSHCRERHDSSNYWNKHSIGICLIGNFNNTKPTEKQWRSLVRLVSFLQERYNIPTNRIKGHRDIKPTDCPGRRFSFRQLYARLRRYKDTSGSAVASRRKNPSGL